tara:strand:- start:1147 stop:2874 length:1728 start_codon:yes stop_codon:yes gene_type:complete
LEKTPVTNDTEMPPPPPTEPSQPQDTVIERIKISDDYKEEALKQIKSLVTGNKCDPESVTLEEFEGEVLHFQAENMLNIVKKVSHRNMPGRVEGAKKVDNELAARDAMSKAYLTLTDDKDMERKIRDTVLGRPDQGFAVDNVVMPLPFWKKEFVVIEPCLTCKSSGNVTCLPCSGKGLSLCPRCRGSAHTHCAHCNGAQMVAAQNGQRIQCPICHGRGKVGCNGCNQTGRIQCKTCRSRGTTTCPNCQGNAWSSVIHTLELQVRTAFDYPREKLPEKVVALIEEHGHKIKEFAEIRIAEDQESVVNREDGEKARQHEVADKRKDIRFPLLYEVILPYGHIEYGINGKSYYTFLFGNKAALAHVSPFLDDLTKNGVRKLQDAAELRGDVYENLKMAGEYRSVKEGIIFTASLPLSKARQKLKHANPLGLSDDAIKNIIALSDRALKNITKKPRIMGLGIAAALNAAVFGAYFLTPVRGAIIGKIANTSLHGVIDGLILFAMMYVGVMTIQMTADSAVKKTMAMLLPGGIKTAPPKLGLITYGNVGVCLAVFAAIVALTPSIGASAPSWYTYLLNMI